MIFQPYILVLVMSLSCLLSQPAASAALRVEMLTEETLIPMDVYHDPQSQLSTENILHPSAVFVPLTKRNQLFEKGVFWLRFSLEQSVEAAQEFRIFHKFAYTDRITLYQLENQNLNPIGEQGDRTLLNTVNLGRLPQFKLTTQKGQQNYLMRVEATGPVHLSFYIQSEESFNQKHRFQNLWIGLLFGSVVVMMAYNLLLGLRLGHRAYFVYVGYICGFLFVQGIFTGILQSLRPINSFWITILNQGLIIAAELTGICGSLFTIQFLSMRKYLPSLYRTILCVYPLSLANMILAFYSLDLATYCILVSNGAYTLLILTAALQTCHKGFRPAYYFTAAWVLLLSGSLITMGRIYGFLPDTSFTTWSQFAGGILEMVFLSLALGDRMNYSEQKAAKALQDREALLANIRMEQALSSEREISEKTQRLEIDLRFQLAASIAHRLNNPLNYIQINLGVLMQEIIALERSFADIIPSEHEDDPEVKAMKDVFQRHFKSLRDPARYIQEGLDRSSDSVKEMRALSGLDGNALSTFQLSDFRRLVRQRLFEQANQSRILLKDDESNLTIIGNLHTYMSVVDLLLTYAAQTGKGMITLAIKTDRPSEFCIEVEALFPLDQALQGAIERCLQNILKASPVSAEVRWEPNRCLCSVKAEIKDISDVA